MANEKMRSAHAKHIKQTQAFLKSNNADNEVKTTLDPTNTEMTVDDQNSDITSEKEYLQAMSDLTDKSPFAQYSSKSISSEATTQTTVPAGDNEQSQFNYELMPNVVTVDKDQLEELMDQNITMKKEIGQLVSLFKIFEGLISGKANVGSLVMMLPKIMSNPEIGKQIADIHPIIEKYTETQ